MGQLEGHVAIVTGAGSGFGRAIATRLAAEGAAVALVGRRLEPLREAAAAAGGRTICIAADVTKTEDVSRLVAETEAAFGPVSLLVSNAGYGAPYGPLWEIDPEAWWAAQTLHQKAPMMLLRALLPGMIERRAGRVVVVSAIARRLTAPFLSSYCVGKSGQSRLIEVAAAETRERGLALFSIDPGFVFTGIAQETVSDPAARKWLAGMVGRLEAKREDPEDTADLARCAQRVVDLFSGRYDALTGGFFELPDDLDAKLKELAQ